MQESSIIESARSVMTTLFITHEKTFDFSRFSLIGQRVQLIDLSDKSLTSTGSITEIKTSEFGVHRSVIVDFRNRDQVLCAKVEFEVIERKRGLKSSVLQALCEYAKASELTNSSKIAQ